MTPEAYAKALEKRLLIITKANSRATVHRSAYLDYIGFKIFDADGNVVGERRFLGLFSSAAYRTSVRDLPVVKRKVAEVVERSGPVAAQPLRQGPDGDPGDLPARRAVPDHHRRALPHRRWACCAWPGGGSCGCSCAATPTAGSSPAWSTCPGTGSPPPTGCASRRSCSRELNGIGVDYTTRVSESKLARVHFIVRTDPATRPATSTSTT